MVEVLPLGHVRLWAEFRAVLGDRPRDASSPLTMALTLLHSSILEAWTSSSEILTGDQATSVLSLLPSQGRGAQYSTIHGSRAMSVLFTPSPAPVMPGMWFLVLGNHL